MASTFFILLLTLINAFLCECSDEQARLPSTDAFYTPDNSDWAELPAGTILKHREVKLGTLIPNAPSQAKAFQLLYVTQNVTELPAYTVTTIIVPPRPNYNRLLSFQIAYDAPDIDCSPSYGLQFGAEGNAVVWNMPQRLSVLPFLMRGPILNIPDYEGTNAAFTVGPQTAFQTLDSIRAALKSTDITGLDKNADTVMYGYSGGGFATEWASEFHATYAPDLRIIGAVVGGPPPNITKTYLSIEGGEMSAINAYAVLGVMNAFPNVSDYLHEHLLPQHKRTFLNSQHRCHPKNCKPPLLKGIKISDFFDNGNKFLNVFEDVLNINGVMGRREAPKFPLFVYKGLNDNITVDNEDVDALVESFCTKGTKVRYYRYEDLGHADALVAGMVPAWNWISGIFNGILYVRKKGLAI
ncbi:putative lipase [Aspergillus karnatakaensis]|uniref:putative lipase n=1 Tax=Aspergillus karnatakaensis TaxID=1810916 RepID=UPI003CCC989E